MTMNIKEEIEKIVSNPDIGKYSYDKVESLIELFKQWALEMVGEEEHSNTGYEFGEDYHIGYERAQDDIKERIEDGIK